MDHGRLWWVVVALGLRIMVDRRVWSSKFFGFFFFFFCSDRCLKEEMGMAFCYWFDLILGWIFLWVHGGGVGGCRGLV